MISAPLGYWKLLLVSLTILVMSSIASSLAAVPSLSQTFAIHDTTNLATATTISRNWSGYVAIQGSYTSVTGTWSVPQVTSSGTAAADATWVGIGGLSSSDLLQSGTQNIVSPGGQIASFAFFEMLPYAAQPIPITVRPGDSVTVSLAAYAKNQWRLSFQDTTTGQAYTTTALYPSSLSSAEWIEEAPSRGHKILPLDHFGTVQFSGDSTTKAGERIDMAQSNAQPIVLVSKNNQQLATPSSIGGDGASFAVTRE